jgi:cysteinyl-tRNA synthetase
MTGKKELFQPIDPWKVRMYVCGMTVYDYCHIGHARVMVFFDTVIRWLQYQGYDVIYARNITDIDDKIIRCSQRNNENFQTLTARFIKAMDEDLSKLGILRPTYEPRATEAIYDIIDMVKKLINKGFAYIGVSGDVYYDVSCFKNYGRLANKKLEDLRAVSRIGVEEYKIDPLDFVLWKMAKAGEPGWSSPWGMGRPGWHIECSAMSARCLGENFDI